MSRTIEKLPFQKHKTWNDYVNELCAKYGISNDSYDVKRFEYKVTKSFDYFKNAILGGDEVITERQVNAIKRFIGFIEGQYSFDFEYDGGKVFFTCSKDNLIISRLYFCPALNFNEKRFKEFLFRDLPTLKAKMIDENK